MNGMDEDRPSSGGTGGQGEMEAAAAFELLGNETRLSILLGLWEAHEPLAPDAAVGFTALRERIGVRDSGQFNYHLRKLLGRYVERTDAGYTLSPQGLSLVQTVVAGTDGDVTLPPTDIDVDCPLCGAGTTISYENGWLYHRCRSCDGGFGGPEAFPRGILFAEPLAPAALRDRSPSELYAMAVFELLATVSLKMAGICPTCGGRIDAAVDVCEDHDASPGSSCEHCGNATSARVSWVCQVCKYRGSASPAGAVGLHPAVVAFYYDHGIEVGYPATDFESARTVLDLLRTHEQEVLTTDPLRIAVTVRYDDDTLRLVLDETLSVVASE